MSECNILDKCNIIILYEWKTYSKCYDIIIILFNIPTNIMVFPIY